MADYSKPILGADDASKRLIIEVLAGENTYGFDIDSIFYIEQENKWIVIEFLKTDHQHLKPSESHPNRYWWKNWRKFWSLWRLKEALGNAELYLVNYEDEAHAQSQGRPEREFYVIKVKKVIYGGAGKLLDEWKATMTFYEFQKWYLEINNRAGKK